MLSKSKPLSFTELYDFKSNPFLSRHPSLRFRNELDFIDALIKDQEDQPGGADKSPAHGLAL